MRVGWGKLYNALYRGTVTRIDCKDGDLIKRGAEITYLMATDNKGRSLTGGSSGPVHAPFDGVIRLYIEQGSSRHGSRWLLREQLPDKNAA